MPEPGQLRHNPWGAVLIYAFLPSRLSWQWLAVDPCYEAFPQLDALPEGTIIDVKALPAVVIVKEAPARPTRIDDETLEALLREADAMGRES